MPLVFGHICSCSQLREKPGEMERNGGGGGNCVGKFAYHTHGERLEKQFGSRCQFAYATVSRLSGGLRCDASSCCAAPAFDGSRSTHMKEEVCVMRTMGNLSRYGMSLSLVCSDTLLRGLT